MKPAISVADKARAKINGDVTVDRTAAAISNKRHQALWRTIAHVHHNDVGAPPQTPLPHALPMVA